MPQADINRRLLLAIGALLLPAIGDALADTADTADTDTPRPDSGGELTTACVPWTPEVQGACPPASAITFTAGFGPREVPLDPQELGTFADGECCYVVQVVGTVMGCGCNQGRRLLIERLPRTAGLAATRGWHDPRVRPPTCTGLDRARRSHLARFWASVGLNEHASIASFHRVALELMAFGAPAPLIAGAQRAADDELRHARRAFTLASAFAGAPVGPTVLSVDGFSLAASRAELAARSVREGCVEETVSVGVASAMLAVATDPAVRSVLSGIVDDEIRHAVFSWRLLKWLWAESSAAERLGIRDAFATDQPAPEAGYAPFPDDLGAWGIPSDGVLQAAGLATRRSVVDPLAARFCA